MQLKKLALAMTLSAAILPAHADETSEETAAGTDEPGDSPATHTVAVGENLYRIGLQYGISWVTLAELNGLDNPNDIKAGQELLLVGGDDNGVPTPEPTPSPATETTYTVQEGDTLYYIGLIFDLSWVQIAEANGIVNPNSDNTNSRLGINFFRRRIAKDFIDFSSSLFCLYL